jgi:2-polyprenyl-3-methyl-5-hydroxy-6-metoxy-1,4-benzoquinol methylase
MENDKTQARQRVREIEQRMSSASDSSGFFDTVYATANGDTRSIPWADLQPHPLALNWLESQHVEGTGRRALVVGCGLGDDAEELARRGFQVTAFDVSPTAIAWSKARFPASPVSYQVADLLATPAAWQQAFDFVLEIYTIQSLPLALRTQVIANIASFVAPGGQLLIVCRGRDPQEEPASRPWPLTRAELAAFEQVGLREIAFEEIRDESGRHFRAVYQR